MFTSNVRDFFPLHVPDVRVKAAALLFCSLNIVALPAQDEPTCISGLPSEASSAASIFVRPLATRLRIRKINPAVECSFVVQALWSDRRAPSTVAQGDEPPMNFLESRENGS